MFLQILLQAQGAGWQQMMIFVAIGVVFYFFLIRPQQKKQKDQKKFVEETKKGDKVVTVGGIHGKIVAIEGDTVTLDVDRGTKITVEKNSISMESSKRVNQG